MLPLSIRLETERLVLRLPKREDIPHIFSATRYEGFNDGMLWEAPETEEELLAPFERTIPAWYAGNYSFAFESKTDGTFLGRISIRQTKEKDVWNIGYWTHPLHQGQGYMQEAVRAILQLGFERLQAIRIEACYAPWNKASEKVLVHNGFQFQRYIEKGYQKKGKWVPENEVGISREAWQKRSEPESSRE
jgi:ribosomal-protein-alanine N-acetyltransferase